MTQGPGGAASPPNPPQGNGQNSGQQPGQTPQPAQTQAPQGQSGQPNFMPPPPPPNPGGGRVVKKLNPIIERTKLDLEACRDVVNKLVADKEIKAIEHMLANPAAPAKPEQPIEQYRLASTCAAKWDYMSGSDQYRLCSECKCFVYDFTKMDLADAEKVVFQREGKQASRYYRRKDGRFLTQDCPVAVARGRRTLMMIGGSALAIVAAVAFMLIMPKPEPEPVTATETSAPEEEAAEEPVASKKKDTTTPGDSFSNSPTADPYASMPPPVYMPGQTQGNQSMQGQYAPPPGFDASGMALPPGGTPGQPPVGYMPAYPGSDAPGGAPQIVPSGVVPVAPQAAPQAVPPVVPPASAPAASQPVPAQPAAPAPEAAPAQPGGNPYVKTYQ